MKFARIIVTSCLWLGVSLIGTSAFAQFDLASNRLSRDSAYDELAEEVAALESHGNLLKKVVRLVTPTVVHLESRKTEYGRAQPESFEEAGSGVVILIDGKPCIVTNRHVIKDANLPEVLIRTSDGRKLHAIKAWSDSTTDIAIVQVAERDLVAARLGDSSKVEIGDFVLAVGSPFGLSHSVSYGIISAKGRRDLELGTDDVQFQDFLQTDAAINPGNSGGPLLNLRGEVVGINTAIASNSGGNEGVSFAIPIRMVTFVARQLLKKGVVEHAYLGVRLDNQFSIESARILGLTRVQGARVKAITPNSPAHSARLQVNDIILKFDGTRIADDSHLVNVVSLTPVSKQVEVELIRNRRPERVSVRVGKRRDFEAPVVNASK